MRNLRAITILTSLAVTASCGSSGGFVQGSSENHKSSNTGATARGTLSKPTIVKSMVEARTKQVPDKFLPATDTLLKFDQFKGKDGNEVKSDYRGTGLSLDATDADVDLRGFDTSIKNQGSTSLCTSFATIAGMESVLKRKYGKDIDLSERHLWSLYGDYMAINAIASAERNWIVGEDSWPFNRNQPVKNIAANGVGTIDTYTVTLTSVTQIIADLRDKNPVVMSIGITNPMLLRDGVINKWGSATQMGHAMLAVGVMFDDSLTQEGGGYLILKNSYGIDSGDNGYAYLPLNYCNNQNRRCYSWAIRDASLKNESIPQPQPQPQPDAGAVVTATDLKIQVNYLGRVEGGNMAFTLSLAGAADKLSQIAAVTFKVHPTWGDSYLYTDEDGPEFSTDTYSTYARGWRTDGAVVTTKTGKTINLPGILINY